MSTSDTIVFLILVFVSAILIFFLKRLIKPKEKKNLSKIFIIIFALMLFWLVCMILQIIFLDKYNINLKYFFDLYYISIVFLPVAFYFMTIIFENGKVKFKWSYILLFIIPITSLILLWTNDLHHLFYKEYSMNISITYGPWFYVHTYYTYLLFVVSLIKLLRYSIKNSGFFSKQAILLIVGSLVPIIVNMLGSIGSISMSIYATPIAFSVTIICFTIGIFKFDLFKIAPIALQKIVDRISDGYVVLDDNNIIIDFNKTFLDIFKLKPEDIRSKNFIKLLQEKKISSQTVEKISKSIKKANSAEITVSFEQHFSEIRKYFRIEITSINSDNNSLGTLFLFKDITQHKEDMETIRNNQDILMERERLAGLGQLIGGIAHNLKTPIMSIAGATQGLENLIKEYDESIDDPLVNSQDHHDIAKDMEAWIPKIRAHLEYMSDIITTVKGQAVASLSTDDSEEFTISELVKRVNILMKHELKNAYIYLNILMKVDENTVIDGNVNVLVQVVNNIISNAIQAYDGKHDQNIQFEISQKENNMIFSITDFAGGLSKEVQDRLFKEMVTTKGKNGTGLGLYMSYSNIKAHFGGDITYKTEDGKGTTFNIVIPIKK
mgnify:FL=1